MHHVLTITVVAGSLAIPSEPTFSLEPEDTLTIQAEPEDSSVTKVQIEKIDFFASPSGLHPIASFALEEGQNAPPGISWDWAKLKNGGAEAADWRLEISGSMAESPHAWNVSVTLGLSEDGLRASASGTSVDPRIEPNARLPPRTESCEDIEPIPEQNLQVTVLSTDGKALTSHSSTEFNLGFHSGAGPVLNVNLVPADGLSLSHPGLTRFYFVDSLTSRVVSDYGLAAMMRMPPGVTMPSVAFRNNGSDFAAHYRVYFFGTVRNGNPGPEILGWMSDPELTLRTTAFGGGG